MLEYEMKNQDSYTTAQSMYDLMAKLFPICRSITGDGVRHTLKIINEHIDLTLHEVKTGTKAFDWVVPKEWNIYDAYIMDESGNKIVDFADNNLHVVGYSTPVDQWMDLEELYGHLHTREDMPEAIPYVTSYYKEYWGFCLSQKQKERLAPGRYRVFIDSELKDGHLTYGECILPGETEEEIFLSTYICHPSMANNELSGPVLATYLARWLREQPRRYTYRIVFVPETIGSIVYVSRHLETLRKRVAAGFNLTCMGDDLAYSFVPSRKGKSYADRVALHVLRWKHPDFLSYTFLDRGSDERQYCSPGVDLPVVTVCRSKYAAYPAYHTSLDNLDFVSADGLAGSFDLLTACLDLIERNQRYRATHCCEPQLGKRGLYPSLSTSTSGASVRDMMNILAYADGENDLIDIADILGKPVWELYAILDRLVEAEVLALAA